MFPDKQSVRLYLGDDVIGNPNQGREDIFPCLQIFLSVLHLSGAIKVGGGIPLGKHLQSHIVTGGLNYLFMTECEVHVSGNARINDLYLQCIRVVGSSPTPNPTILEHIPIGF